MINSNRKRDKLTNNVYYICNIKLYNYKVDQSSNNATI